MLDSHVNDGSRPDNREWHEFGHHFMADAFGNRIPDNGITPSKNHDGYKNASTSDSWVEGFAEFFSLLVNVEIAKDGTPPQIISLDRHGFKSGSKLGELAFSQYAEF